MDDSANRLDELNALLCRRIGLNPQSVHHGHIEDAVRARMASCGIDRPGQYVNRLEEDEAEWQELIERLVVVESWFFRDVQPYRFLERHVRDEWEPRHRDQTLRLLSIPCGAGEEPYSMAMTLLSLGLDAGRFSVDAIDISQRALHEAQQGHYGESSFRERETPVADYRTRFFHAAGTRLAVNDEVKACVHFRQGNLVDPGFLGGESRFDVVFCRNLLIYLSADARRVALGNLRRLMQPDGVLYVGHVEAGSLREERFAGYDDAFPFAFRAEPAMTAAPIPRAAKSPRTPRPLPKPAISPRVPVAVAAPPAADPHVELATAREIADRGRLDEGAALCLEWMKKHPPRADAYCLLGVIRQAQQDWAQAEKCFHKALYLDPRHHESLVHLALLATRRGEESAAINFRRRAEKIKAEG